MPLSAEASREVADLLTEHPDWPTSRVRAEAGLSPRDLFAVKRLRSQMGVPEPAGATKPGKGGGKRPARAEALDDDGDSLALPTGPKRGGPGSQKRPQSLLAPVLPRIAQALVVGVVSATGNLTRGHAPMTAQEATAVAVPAVRILDRTAAKYIKRSGKVSPNQEDAAIIALTVLGWLVGWMVASVTGKPRHAQPPAQGQAQAQQDQPQPFAPAAVPVSAGDRRAPLSSDDDADLYAGSEPLAPGATGATSASAATLHATGAGPDVPPVSEAVWAAIMPSDDGLALAVG